jgi:hypothetical protein
MDRQTGQGQRHDLFMHPDVVVPLVSGFLDPLLVHR